MSTRDGNEVFSQNPLTQQPDVVKRKIEEARTKNEVLRVQDVKHDPLGLDIPVEVCPLPSEGKIYPPGHPLHNTMGVEFHPMTAREEDILTTRAYLKKGTVMTELLRSCLTNKSINPDDLVSGDKSAIMVAIRITGYGPDYEAMIKCSDCGEKYEHTFDLTRLEVSPLTMEPRTQYINEFEFMLPQSKKRVVFKLLNGHDENEVSEHEEKKKKLKLSKGENSVTRNLLQSIISVDGVSDRASISRFINVMPARDSRALREYISKNAPNIDMSQEVKCESCGHVETVSMPMNASFFWPDVGK